MIGVFHLFYEQATFTMNNSSSPAHVSVVPSVVPPYDRTEILPELKTLMSDIFEHGEALPDQVYKEMLDNCARIQRSIGELVATADQASSGDVYRRRYNVLYETYHKTAADLTSLTHRYKRVEEEKKSLLKKIEENSVPTLPPAPSVCCFKALQAAFDKNPEINAKTARCGCCHMRYPVGYGGQNFRSEAQKHHRGTCGHTYKSCSTCHGQNKREERMKAFAATFAPR